MTVTAIPLQNHFHLSRLKLGTQAPWFLSPSVLWHVSVPHSFLWLNNNIPLHGYATFWLSIHQLMDISVVPTFWLLWVMLLWIFMHEYVWTYLFHPLWVYTLEKSYYVMSLILWPLFLLNCLRNCQTIFQRGSNILHVHQRCENSTFSTSSLTFLIFFLIYCLFDDGQPSGWQVGSHCVFSNG